MRIRYGQFNISDFILTLDRDYYKSSSSTINQNNNNNNMIYGIITVIDKTKIKIVRTVMMKRVDEDRYGNNSTLVKFVIFTQSDTTANKLSDVSIRCCSGWEFCFSIMDAVSDRFLILKCDTFSSIKLFLRSENDERSTGAIVFSQKFCPESRSLSSLIFDCAACMSQISEFPYINTYPLSNDPAILSNINAMLDPVSCYAVDNKSFAISDDLRAAVQRLSSSLAYFRTALFAEDGGEEEGSLSQSFRAFAALSEASQPSSPAVTPLLSNLVLPQYKTATLAKSFLTSLSADLVASPPVTMDLIEKMLAIFNTMKTRDSEAAKPLSKSSKNAILYERSGDEEEQSWSWVQFHSFCAVSGLWLLKQSELALYLLIKHGDKSREDNSTLGLISEELDAVRMAFQCIDAELMGAIQTTDLFYLLQDMGEEYSEEELLVAVSELDGDNLGLVFFEDFISWWCS